MSRISRIHGFEKFFRDHEKHLFLADKSDVQSALRLCAGMRELNGTGWSKDKTMLSLGKMPRSVYFSPVWNKLGMDRLAPEEQEEAQEAFFKTFSKFKTRW